VNSKLIYNNELSTIVITYQCQCKKYTFKPQWFLKVGINILSFGSSNMALYDHGPSNMALYKFSSHCVRYPGDLLKSSGI